MDRIPIAILISGRGSNMQALIEACARPDYPARIVLVFSNNEKAAGLKIAQDAGLATHALDHRQFASRSAFEAQLHKILQKAGVRVICLAGFMRILTSEFVKAWDGRILNIHPSLLPKYPGLDTHKRALDSGDAIHGCTVHLVIPEVDLGPILGQASVPVRPSDTVDVLARRVLKEEHQLYPDVLERYLRNMTA